MIRLRAGSLETDSEGSYPTQSTVSTQSSISEHMEGTPTNFTGFFTKINAEREKNIQKNFSGRKSPFHDGKCPVPSSHTPKQLARPPFSFSQLIRDVLLENDNLTVTEICEILSKNHPKYFSMDSKKWKANVRNCLSSKVDFVKDNSRKTKCYWSLCPQIKAKLKSSSCHKFGNMKENLPPLLGSAGNYVPIAPKVDYFESYSLDGLAKSTENYLTPVKQCNDVIVNRQCQSEDINISRYLGKNIKRSHSGEPQTVGATRKKLFTERTCRTERDSMKFRKHLESTDSYRVRIQANSISEANDNAVFNEHYNMTINRRGGSPTEFTSCDLRRIQWNSSLAEPLSIFQDQADTVRLGGEEKEQSLVRIKKRADSNSKSSLVCNNTKESLLLGINKVEKNDVLVNEIESTEIETTEYETKEIERNEVDTIKYEAKRVKKNGAQDVKPESIDVEGNEVERNEAEAIECAANELKNNGVETIEVDSIKVETTKIERNDAAAIGHEAEDVEVSDIREMQEVFDELSQSSFCDSPDYHTHLSPSLDLSPLDELPDLFSQKERTQKTN